VALVIVSVKMFRTQAEITLEIRQFVIVYDPLFQTEILVGLTVNECRIVLGR
jgi:hypothetical protein